ncbi:hypothetical protein QWY90_06185 [Flavobacterium paronense]|uniref:SGNH/GDSL hydrolase family protein n=1 Tax=Flavobacterium paronense TaxID=1392775 RepID=A0ABV5GB93_9FLAO|nr:hypothetical protein [Flavobacterium paronense]MDN3676895.1 hypothetical protein [Flavobacterium paronense]
MRIFIKKTVLFVSIPIVCFTLFIVILEFINYEIATSERLDSSITTVFIGDSHIAQAINDSRLENCVNDAQTSESLYFSYYKLKILLKNNPSIKDVYLGFGYHSVTSYYDKFILGEFSNAISSRYFSLLPFNEKLRILNANRNDFFSYLKVVVKNDILNILRGRKTYHGGFANSFSNTKAIEWSIKKRVLTQYYNEGSLSDYSLLNIEYLNKIEELCKKSNVNLILVNTPIYKLYKNKIPEKFKVKYKQLSEGMKIKILDLSDLLSKEYLFIPDGDHVSQEGALTTTEYISKKLK